MIWQVVRRGWRQLAVLLAVLVVFSLQSYRLYDLQLNVSAQTTATLQGYYAADVYVPETQSTSRGSIVDINSLPLVDTLTVYKLAANPHDIPTGARSAVAQVLADVLYPLQLPTGVLVHNFDAITLAKAIHQQHVQDFLTAISNTKYNYVCLAWDGPTVAGCPYHHNLSQAQLDTILNDLSNAAPDGYPGINPPEPQDQPAYPNKSLAAQVLGYVDSNTQTARGLSVEVGTYGVEAHYNDLLSGIAGNDVVPRGTQGGANTANQTGATLRLTLDALMQLYAENDLTAEVKKEHATGGSIIVERVSDGSIVAMASTPSYDPNDLDTLIAQLTKQATSNGKFDLTRFEKLEYNIFPNPAISKVYEPGSTFKAITVAIGFDAGYFNERTKVNDPGYLAIDANPNDNIHNWCADACPFGGLETPNTMLHWSSNVGAAKFGSMIPTTVWYDYLTNHFGFGKKTGVDLGGADEEVTGTVRQPTDTSLTPAWEPIDKVEQAFGQAIAVTPLQLANAYAALANRGVLPQPHILQSYTLAGKTVTPSYPPLGTAVTQETSDRMTNLLVQQAVGGEACQALLPGYDIAAKTGTASIPGDSQNTIASTAAYGPVGADPNDQFVVLVKVDKPVDIYGSEVAAPIVRDLFYHLVNRYQIAPAAHPQQPTDGVCRYVNSSQRVPWQP